MENHEKGELHILELHSNKNLLEEAASLINSEWPRHLNTRVNSLNKDPEKNGFPVSFLLLLNENVIGHARIMSLSNIEDATFIESVVVEKSHRGKGYGRFIMKACENYAKSKGVKSIYLTTEDKIQFYSKLSYELTSPISFTFSSSSTVQQICKQFLTQDTERIEQINVKCNQKDASNIISNKHGVNSEALSSPPPPPPPPIPSKNLIVMHSNDSKQKVFMKKMLVLD